MNNGVFTFQTLHPDIVMDALFKRGIRVDSGLTPPDGYEDRVYQFQDRDHRRFVVRFYRPKRWTAGQVLGEHQFALQLVNDEIPVTVPAVFNCQTLLNHQGFYFAVFSDVGGHQFGADNIDQMEVIGRYLGRMRQAERKQLFTHRPTTGLNKYLTEPRRLFEDTTLMPSGSKATFLKATDGLIAIVTVHWQEDFAALRLYGDRHTGNILQHDGPMFVDLDDTRNGLTVQDLWMLFNSDKAKQRIQLETVIETYEGFSKFGAAEVGLIEPSRVVRSVYYLT